MKRKKLLILGAAGMAGHMIYDYLKNHQEYEIIHTVHTRKLNEESILLDVTNTEDVASLIKRIRPDIIINCIGILIKGANSNPANAIFVNSYFPHFLKNICDEVKAKLIHISTDCVFSGKKGEYTENDIRDADDIYGKSKALGEVIDQNHLTIRTSIIGPEIKKEGEGLFHWFMNQEENIEGYSKAFWGGVTTLELAKFIKYVIDNRGFSKLVHLTNNNKISKKDLLEIINEEFNRKIIIKPNSQKKIDKSLKTDFDEISKFVPSYSEMIHNLRVLIYADKKYQNIYSL